MKKLFFSVLLLLLTRNSVAGGYQVENYIGHVGNYPIHMSIQKYAFGSGLTIEGSYYYDKKMIPIPLYGKYNGQNSISLCEIHNETDFQKVIIHGSKLGFETASCPFQLTFTEDYATGKWVSNKNTYDVKLKRTGILSNTKFWSIKGNVEIPFWGQTKNHMFIGVYENTGINKVKVINKSTRQTIQEFNPQENDCSFGFFMTSIYMNIENSIPNTVMLNCYSPRDGELAFYSLDKKTGNFKFSYMK